MQIEIASRIRAEVGEGAVWDDRAQVLWWVDIPAGLIHRTDPETGTTDSFDAGEPVGCLAVRAGGGLILAAKSGFRTFDPDTGASDPVAAPEAQAVM